MEGVQGQGGVWECVSAIQSSLMTSDGTPYLLSLHGKFTYSPTFFYEWLWEGSDKSGSILEGLVAYHPPREEK